MGIGSRLTFAFLTVILVLVLVHAGYSLANDYRTTRQAAIERLATARSKLGKEFNDIEQVNGNIAFAVCQDQSAMNALAAHDRSGMAQALKSIANKTGLVGFITVVDQAGNIFYSTDAPNKSGYPVKQSNGIDIVLTKNTTYTGAACFSPTGALTLSSMTPIRVGGGRVGGVVIVSQPLNNEFLIGTVTKFALDSEHLTAIDIALLSAKENKLVALTPNLMSPATGGPFVTELEKYGAQALSKVNKNDVLTKILRMQNPGFEAGGRWWIQVNLAETEAGEPKKADDLIAAMLLTTPVPDLTARLTSVLLLAGVSGAVGLAFSFIFTAGISKQVNEPLKFLIDRTNELANQRSYIPPLEGLSGDWLELGELIDTAVLNMRTSVQSMRQQISKQAAEVEDRVKAADDTAVQLDALNRKYSHQAKQLSEVSKQINHANRQSVLLQHKLDSVLQVSTEGFLLLDQFGNVLSANPTFLNWVGTSEGEIAGRLCFDLVKRPGEPRNHDGEGQAFAKHHGNPNELVNRFYPEGVIYHRYQDKSISVLAHLQPITSEDSSIQGYVMVLRDKSLRSEIAQLRGEIVAMLTENIRAPLFQAEGHWHTILNSVAQTMPPAVGQSLADLHLHYEQLLGLVDSLLMIYGGTVPPQAVPREQLVVTRLVSECLEQVSGLARERQLALDYRSVTGLPNIAANRESVKAVLIQLLEKMISITAPGGRVRVECTARGQEMRIGVSSSGPSLPESEIVDMFVGFIEGKHHNATYSSRLSMYLARNNVERMSGKIWAESEQGRGTVIYFTLPMQ